MRVRVLMMMLKLSRALDPSDGLPCSLRTAAEKVSILLEFIAKLMMAMTVMVKMKPVTTVVQVLSLGAQLQLVLGAIHESVDSQG